MVDQSQCKPSGTGKRSTLLSPIQSQPIPMPNEFSIVFGDENKQNDSQIDFANLTVDVDQENKQILVDVSASMSLAQNLHQSVNQSLNASACVVIEDTFVKSPNHTQLLRDSINVTKSPIDIDNSCYKSIEVVQDDSLKTDTTPAMAYFSFERNRTPIGVIRLRKVTPKIDTPEQNISDDEAYEVVVVNKSRHSHMLLSPVGTMNSTMFDIEGDSPATNYPMSPINSEIASKSPAKAHPFPFSPRIMLHRINSIDEYQENLPVQETPKMTMDRNQRRASKTKATRTKNGKNDSNECHIQFS